MHMGIPQAGHQVFAGQAHGLLWLVAGCVLGVDHGQDGIALEQDRLALHQLAIGNIDQRGTCQRDIGTHWRGSLGMIGNQHANNGGANEF